jgi:signal transduction histidine kinase
VRASRHALRDRLVLEAGLAAAGTDAGSLWRRGDDETWRPSVERGRRGGRFESERSVRRALASPLAPSLPGTSIVRAEALQRGAALVLVGSVDEATEDALEALLVTVLLVESADPDAGGPDAPLPTSAADAGSNGRIQHDLRNALASLGATRQVLERFGADLPPAERHAYEDAVERECERAGALLALGITGQAARPRGASIGEITLDVVAVERAATQALGQSMEVDIEPACRDREPATGGDAWSRVVRNLITNAREAAAARGLRSTVSVHLSTNGSDGRLIVEDAAGGLPEVPVRLLFEEGFTTGKAGGSGRGLAVVREIVVGAGGAILTERIRGGARWTVWIPTVARPSP